MHSGGSESLQVYTKRISFGAQPNKQCNVSDNVSRGSGVSVNNADDRGSGCGSHDDSLLSLHMLNDVMSCIL